MHDVAQVTVAGSLAESPITWTVEDETWTVVSLLVDGDLFQFFACGSWARVIDKLGVGSVMLCHLILDPTEFADGEQDQDPQYVFFKLKTMCILSRDVATLGPDDLVIVDD
jgi:hypothetical protein